jgi:hypothetical protein
MKRFGLFSKLSQRSDFAVPKPDFAVDMARPQPIFTFRRRLKD